MILFINLFITAICCPTVLIFGDACEKRLKREGFEFVKCKKSNLKKIANPILVALRISMPFYNLILVIVILFLGDELYENAKNELLKQGKIYLSTEEILGDEDEFLSREETKTCAETIEKENIEKNEEMTLEERLVCLEREKEKLIDQSIEEHSVNRLVQSQQAPVLRKIKNSK